MDIDHLLQVREIEQLKYRYMRAVDTRDWELLASTLTPDVTAAYGKKLTFANRDELVTGLSRALLDDKISVHHLHQPEITIDGDEATGSWALMDRVITKSTNMMLEGAAFYTDDYRRVDGQWLIARTTYVRLYEAVFSLADMPSFTLTDDVFSDS